MTTDAWITLVVLVATFGILAFDRLPAAAAMGAAVGVLLLADVVDQSEARHSALSQVLKRFFDDSPRLLVLDLLGHERTDADELRHVRELIEQAPPDAGDATRKRKRRR